VRKVASIILFSAFVFSSLGRPATAVAQGRAVDPLFVFGDSLSDTGNDFLATKFQLNLDPAIPPSESPHATYFLGRFSNGPVAFEYFWCALNHQHPCTTGLTPSLTPGATPGVDRGISFAFGGSGSGDYTHISEYFDVPGLQTQIGMFQGLLYGSEPPAHALYAIFTGANDYFATPPMDPAVVVQNIVWGIERLYYLGARTIMVVDLPDLGAAPISAGNREALSNLTNEHNRRLAEALKALDKHGPHQNLPGLDVIAVTLKEFLKSLPKNTDLTTAAVDTLFQPAAPGQWPVSWCLFTNPLNCPDVPTFNVSREYFFWDAQHPTTTTHERLGRYFVKSLKP
jgi:phospholipase/lecithinase/hemolysin